MSKETKETEEGQDYTEQYAGIIMLRKGKVEENEIWFGTVWNQIVSDGFFKTKEELIGNLNDITLERICRIISGAFGRAIELSTKEKKQ